MKRQERIAGFVTEIWAWYARHKRELPWRDLQIADDTARAYRILVSEVMLQQTQVSRVKIVFRNFLEQFKEIEDLALATNAEVILAWRGMGYNARALRLRDAARIVVTEHGGIFPAEMEQLRSIKGIGPYTAAAIRNFAFHLPTPCIDTNIRRILHRTFVGPEDSDSGWQMDDRQLLEIAKEVLRVAVPSGGNAANWHAALMDFGSLVQTKNNPRWDICPLTAKGLMKANQKNIPITNRSPLTAPRSPEPGRTMSGRHIPNRIFRGRVVEALRDAPTGLTLEQIGVQICTDWEAAHRVWLQGIVNRLTTETILAKRGERFVLAEG